MHDISYNLLVLSQVLLFMKNSTLHQGCGVVVGVGVARSRGNVPGVEVRVGVDQTASTPTPERFFIL